MLGSQCCATSTKNNYGAFYALMLSVFCCPTRNPFRPRILSYTSFCTGNRSPGLSHPFEESHRPMLSLSALFWKTVIWYGAVLRICLVHAVDLQRKMQSENTHLVDRLFDAICIEHVLVGISCSNAVYQAPCEPYCLPDL